MNHLQTRGHDPADALGESEPTRQQIRVLQVFQEVMAVLSFTAVQALKEV
jgi:hypothetical protein